MCFIKPFLSAVSFRIAYFSMAILPTLILATICSHPAAAQQLPTEPQVSGNAVVNEAVQFDVSRPLAELSRGARAQQGVQLLMPAPMRPKMPHVSGAQQAEVSAVASALQSLSAQPVAASIGLSFEGVGNTSVLNCPSVVGVTVVPPDTNAAVGDTQVVQWVNLCYAVFDKFTGALIAGPFSGTDFWAGFGGGCEADNSGDIIIQWDKANHRWLASQNDFGPNFTGPYQTCIAVSQSADATGSYFRYAFPQPGFPDYPKWGLTRATYYQTQNDFGPAANSFVGVNVCAYDGSRMRAGSSKATQVCILDNAKGTLFDDSMVPADDDSDFGPTNSEVLLGSIDNFFPGDTHVYEYVFTVDFGNPTKSTLAGVDGSMPISVPAFNLAFCGVFPAVSTDCVPQPSAGSELLDTLGDRLLYRLAHFNRDGVQHFVVNHGVNNSTAVAVAWYEFRTRGVGGTDLSLYQSGQTPDDGEFRWMGSVAMDKNGDIALGYSRSSAHPGDFPSIYFAGQSAGERLGTTDAEALIKKGSGSQLKSFNRWGDYSSMALDGNDSCTFWYTTEYYPADGSFAWATWLASLKFPHCL